MKITEVLLDLVWDHKIDKMEFTYIELQKVVKLEIIKQKFLFSKNIVSDHNVYFDVYSKSDYTMQYVWCANIEKDWIDLWYKKRNKLKKMIQKHLESEYIVGNYRNTFEK